jgi:tetratricopeptide (TPR) repeat protein
MSQTPQSVADLFGRYLRRQMTAHAEGLGYADPDGQVTPYEAVPVQPVEPRLAWQDALAVVPHLTTERAAPHWETPPDWPSLVAAQEPAIALAFCLGNFPQMVRDLQPLLTGSDGTVLRRAPIRPVAIAPTLLQWANAERTYPQVLLAVGVLRLARRFEEANTLLTSTGNAPASWRSLRANEEAALAWHRGDAEEALTLWQAQKDSVPVLFNRGMAALFLGRAVEAQTALSKAVAPLPETSAWHHLGQLYLTLAAARAAWFKRG